LPLYEAHRDGCNAADNRGVRGIANVQRPSFGLLARNKYQLTVVHFAPAANVTLAKLDKEHGPIMIRVPVHRRNLFLPRIDPDSRTVICEWGIVHSDGASWDFSKCVEVGEFAPSLRLFEAINRLRHAKGGTWDQSGADLNGDPHSETVNQLG
jgi:hypothetical protein